MMMIMMMIIIIIIKWKPGQRSQYRDQATVGRSGVWIPVGERNFSLQHAQIGCGATRSPVQWIPGSVLGSSAAVKNG